MLELTLRLVFSLAVVLGLLLLLARLGSRRFKGQRGAIVRVLHRQPLTRTTSVSVVSVGSRILVLGTTEHQVRVLTELDPDDLDAADLAGLAGVVGLAGVGAGATAVPVLTGVPSEPAAIALPARGRGAHRADVPVSTHAPHGDGVLAGSVLSVSTWRQALAAATRRAS